VEFDALSDAINFRGVAGTPGNFSLKNHQKTRKFAYTLGYYGVKTFVAQ
jgi:hypothetical protein